MRHFLTCHKIPSGSVANEVNHSKKKTMSQEELEDARKPDYVSSWYEDITPEIGSDLEKNLLNSSDRAEVDAMVEEMFKSEEEGSGGSSPSASSSESGESKDIVIPRTLLDPNCKMTMRRQPSLKQSFSK